MESNYLVFGDSSQEVLVGIEVKGVWSTAWQAGPFTPEERIEALEWLRVEGFNFVFSVPPGESRWIQRHDGTVIFLDHKPAGTIQSCEIPGHDRKFKHEQIPDLGHPVGFHLMCECAGTWISCHSGESGDCCP